MFLLPNNLFIPTILNSVDLMLIVVRALRFLLQSVCSKLCYLTRCQTLHPLVLPYSLLTIWLNPITDFLAV